MSSPPHIELKGVRQHNLKSIDLRIPRGKLVVFTGVSGSGKSSLAFDTIYAEGQRRYVESLSSYARQFFDRLPKPDVDYIEGLPPTIAVEQRAGLISPRSTVATTTEVYDYLRLLYARVGQAHCHICGRPIRGQSLDEIVEQIVSHPDGTRLMVLAPIVRGQAGGHADELAKIQREGFVRMRLDSEIVDVSQHVALDKRKPHHIEAVVDRLVARRDIRPRVSDSVELALRLGDGMVMALHERGGDWVETLYTERYACPECGVGLEELSPRVFSFNSPQGACPKCTGVGTVLELDEDLVAPDPRRSLEEAIEPAARGGAFGDHYRHMLDEFASIFKADLDDTFDALTDEQRQILLHGTAERQQKRFKHAFEGILPSLARRLASSESAAERDRVHAFMSELPCDACRGARLRPEALAVTVAGKSIADVASLSVERALEWFRGLELPHEDAQIAERVVAETRQRLRFLADVGVGYLGLSRRTATLSGGELQRIRLASQVGTGLVGMCYVLDEPTIGLHPCDNARLLDTLAKLRDAGSTVLVVEHDEETIRAADYVYDLGPGPGDAGGHIVAQGAVAQLLKSKDSVTARYLRGDECVAAPRNRRSVEPTYAVTVRGARAHNLKGIDVSFPLGIFCCVAGVSGSGKSTLVLDVLRRALMKELSGSRLKPGEHDELLGAEFVEKLVDIDQSPIGRSPRSNAATYTNVFGALRRLFAMTREAKVRGYGPTRFSFNAKGGRCEACEGQGTKKIDMQFLPDVYVTCDVCRGARYNRETLEVRYRGCNITDVLDMKVAEAAEFFRNVPRLKNALQTLIDVGLGYIQLGQSSTTLSGGEAQRVKLAAELSRRSKGRTLYILDEPTTGLHFADISRLLDVLNRLVDNGNTVLVIEHNLDVIAAADYIIELGPGPGEAGGEVVATGTPEEIARVEGSKTGAWLKKKLRPE